MKQRQEEAKEGKGVVTDDDTFHRWLTLARYLSLFEAETTLSKENFERAVRLE